MKISFVRVRGSGVQGLGARNLGVQVFGAFRVRVIGVQEEVRNSGVPGSGVRNSGVSNSDVRNSGVPYLNVRNSGVPGSGVEDNLSIYFTFNAPHHPKKKHYTLVTLSLSAILRVYEILVPNNCITDIQFRFLSCGDGWDIQNYKNHKLVYFFRSL